MKILHVTSSYYPAFSFGGSVSADYGTDINVASNTTQIDVATTTAGLGKNWKTGKWQNHKNIRIIYFPFSGYVHYSFSLEYINFLWKNIRNYDVIHFSGIWNFPVVFGPLIARKFNKPYIITPHGTLYRETFYKKSKWFKLLHYYSLVKSNLEKANCVHFTTVDERKKINDWLGLELKSKIIPYGIEENLHKLSPEKFRKKFNILKDKKIILFIGRINWKKGLDILFQAFAQLSKKHKNLLLICAGPDPENYFSQLDQLISTDTQKSIIKTGMLNNIDKLNAYNIADLFVLPSYSENFGMTVIEAARQQVPIVISDQVGIYNEFQNNNAALITSCNKMKLYEAINEILTKPQKTELLKKNAYNLFKQNFTQKITANKFANMYKECLKN